MEILAILITELTTDYSYVCSSEMKRLCNLNRKIFLLCEFWENLFLEKLKLGNFLRLDFIVRLEEDMKLIWQIKNVVF